MKNFPVLILLAVLLAAGTGGCKTFRQLFSRTPASMKRDSNDRIRQKQNKAAAKTPKDSSGDPLFDAIYRNKHRQQHTYNDDTVFNSRERELINRSFDNSANSGDNPAIRKLNEKNLDSRKRRSDAVFGTKNGSYF